MAFPIHKLPPHHFHLGDHLFLVVNEFKGCTKIHLRRYRQDPETHLMHPTTNGMTIHPRAWAFFPDTPKECVIVGRRLLITPMPEDHVRLQSMIERDGGFHFSGAITISVDQFYAIRAQEVLHAIAEVQLGPTLLQSMKDQMTRMKSTPAADVTDLDSELGVACAFWDLMKKNFDEAMWELSKCYGCESNQPNQLAHECITWEKNDLYQSVKARVPALLDISAIAKVFCETNVHLIKDSSAESISGLCNLKLISRNIANMFSGDTDCSIFFK